MKSDGIDTNFGFEFPSKNYAHVVGELLHLLPNPAFKLRFIQEAVNEHHKLSAPYTYFAPLERSVYWKTLLDRLERVRPGSRNYAKHLTRKGIISLPRMPLWLIYKFRKTAGLVLLLLLISAMVKPMGAYLEARRPVPGGNFVIKKIDMQMPPQPKPHPEPPEQIENAAPLVQNTRITLDTAPKVHIQKYLTEPIWLVEKKQDSEIYSNGLHIITTHTLENTPRSYYRLARNPNRPPFSWHHTEQVSGILYHASESDMFPFLPEMNKSIKRYSEALIRYIKPRKSYHYFIDRFGRVYRLVREDHAANHAGRSIWADDESIYLNLNHAFIGICFEGRDFEKTADEKTGEGLNTERISADIQPIGISSFNEAQLRSGKELTDWLRVKYNISQNNCVPHALASVNPEKWLIGYHLDLSRGFPFHQFGLSNKYKEPLPSMIEFGFSYDPYFEKIFDGRVWPGIADAEKLLIERARENGMDLSAYLKRLHEKYIRCTQWQPTREKQPENRIARSTS